jgi:cyclophilin family peptidyl-prolyl cis-trans isomerase
MFKFPNLAFVRPLSLIRKSKAIARRQRSSISVAQVELLEDRALLSVGTNELPIAADVVTALPRVAASHAVIDHIHPFLKIIIDGQEVPIPTDIGITAGGHFSPHTHDISGKLHVGEGLLAGVSQESRFVRLDDFFDVWRTTTSVTPASNNPNANFSATQLMDRVADATHSVFMTVNGVLNTEFENYIPHDDDRIVLSYGPADSGPSLAPLSAVTLLAGSPLYIPLDGYDPNGQALSYTVTSSNSAVSIYQPTTNRSLRFTVEGFGDMLFELFDDKAARATDRFATLASQGFFNNIIFHRVVDNFVIQGGDPTGTGGGGSTLADFDDQFDVTLQHNRAGLLSMAKAADDTNDSQFFVTEVPTRSLDSNHTIFGLLVEGESVREAISEVPVGSCVNGSPCLPTTPVVMTSVTVIPNDQENAVMMLSAPIGTTGSSTITVTVTDPDGHTTQRSFTVTIQADTTNNPPFLADIPTVITTVNTPVTFQLTARDAEGNSAFYLDQGTLVANGLEVPVTANPDLDYLVDFNTGLVTVTPTNGLVGTFQISVATAVSTAAVDYQVVTVVINSGPATTNSAPVLDSFGAPYLIAPAGSRLAAEMLNGILITDLLARGVGGNPISDPDAGAVEGIALTVIDKTLGKWQYTFVASPIETDWIDADAAGAISNTSALLLPADANTRLRFVTTLLPRHNTQKSDGSAATPAQGFLPLETRLDTGIMFRAWDRTSGTAGGRADTSTNGGTTAFSTATETAAAYFETRLFRSYNAAAQLNTYTLEQEFNALVTLFGYEDRSTAAYSGFTILMSPIPGVAMASLYRMYFGIAFDSPSTGIQTDMGYRYLTTDLNEAITIEGFAPPAHQAERDGSYFRELGVNSGTAILGYIYSTSQPGTLSMSQIYRLDQFAKPTRTGPPGTPATGSVQQEQGDHVYTTNSAFEMSQPGTWRQEIARGFVRELSPNLGGGNLAPARSAPARSALAEISSPTAAGIGGLPLFRDDRPLDRLVTQVAALLDARPLNGSASLPTSPIQNHETDTEPLADSDDAIANDSFDAAAVDAFWQAAEVDLLVNWDVLSPTAM